jgi:LmbE family N-acetylglucosaminyl deacetylase
MATVVSFHAHPDDEALLTGGTLALLSAQGHQVVIVVATDGSLGQETSRPGTRSRLDELKDSAAILGASKVVFLGYADSGHGPVLFPDPPERQRFVRADPDEAAERLASVLREVGASVLLSYDELDGHRDHVRVHEVGRRAAARSGIRLLEATLPRERARKLTRLMRVLRFFVRVDPSAVQAGNSPVTHRIDVRRYARQKQAALAAHKSQLGLGRAGKAFQILIRFPAPVFGLLLGQEWYVEPGRPGRGLQRQIFS